MGMDPEDLTMARATSAPVPVMADDTKADAQTGSGSNASGARGTAAKAAATDTKTTAPYLGGPWGASFIGKNPDGTAVKGLTWPRRHTRPDIHPYDEIEWELRTASISSETGKTVFEQTDVETPKDWSQLATNVVVSKYFRGHVGTPERERSVKQL